MEVKPIPENVLEAARKWFRNWGSEKSPIKKIKLQLHSFGYGVFLHLFSYSPIFRN